MAPNHERGFQKSSRALALSACSSRLFISTRRVGEEPSTLTQGALGPVRNPVLQHRVRLFSLVPLVWDECKPGILL